MTKRIGESALVVIAVAIGLASCTGEDPTLTSDGADAGGLATGDGGATCPPAQKVCAGGCVAFSDPAFGCSAADCAPCPADDARHQAAVCTSTGACAFADACAAGYGECDGSAANGCETATATDPKNCGTCGNACGTGNTTAPPACAGGKCSFSCAIGFAHCKSSDGTGCETNIATDKDNCGACGHSCLGGDCQDGACKPRFVAESYPTFGALDPGGTGWAYWTNYGVGAGGTVRRMPKDFSAQPTDVATNQNNPTGVALTPTLVYWTEYGASDVRWAKRDNSGAGLAAQGVSGAWAVTTDASDAYFVNRTDAVVLAKTPLGAQLQSTNLVTKGAAISAVGVAVDATYAFVVTVPGQLYRYDKNGANEKALATGVYDFVLDGSDVVFAGGSSLYRIGKDGTCNPAAPCPAPILTSMGNNVTKVAIDAAHLYYETIPTADANGLQGTPTIMRADRDGKNPKALYTRAEDRSSGMLKVDDVAIWWTVQIAGNGMGRVYMLAK